MKIDQIIASTNIVDVWRTLGGEEPMAGRAAAFYRRGDNQSSVSLNQDKGLWYDHRDNVGGGILDLIQHVNACGKREAARWLSDFSGLPLDDKPFTPIQRDDYARRKTEDQQLAQDATDLRRGLEITVQRRIDRCARAVEWFLDNGIDPPGTDLIDANKAMDALRSASLTDMINLYRKTDEKDRASLIETGRLDRENAEDTTRLIVEMLATAPSN